MQCFVGLLFGMPLLWGEVGEVGELSDSSTSIGTVVVVSLVSTCTTSDSGAGAVKIPVQVQSKEYLAVNLVYLVTDPPPLGPPQYLSPWWEDQDLLARRAIWIWVQSKDYYLSPWWEDRDLLARQTIQIMLHLKDYLSPWWEDQQSPPQGK
jgi:hypothetical protein